MYVILLALSLSLDAFTVSFAQGINKSLIPFVSKLTICIVSIFYFAISIFLGKWVGQLFSPSSSKFIGILLMLLMSLWMLLQIFVKESKKDTILQFSMKSLGITFSVIRNPLLCDFDKSKSISPFEAFFLATALSVDSISIGLGYSISGEVSAYAPLFVGLFQFCFLYIGNSLGMKMNHKSGIKTFPLQIVTIFVMFLLCIVRML